MLTLDEEIERLGAIVDEQLPHHARAREGIELDASAFGGIARLWARVGWSAALAASGLERPCPHASKARARELLDAYRRADSSFTLPDDALPETLLVVEVSCVHHGFSFVRAGAADDPELEMVSTGARAVVPLAASSLRWIGNRLVSAAFAHWYQTYVGVSPPEPLTGAAPLPRLSPTLRSLGPDLWLVPLQPDESAMSGGAAEVAHRDLASFVDWLLALPEAGTTLSMSKPPGARIGLADTDVTRPEWRTFVHRHDPDARYHVGRIGEHPVLVHVGRWARELATVPRPQVRAHVEAELRAWGWLAENATWQL